MGGKDHDLNFEGLKYLDCLRGELHITGFQKIAGVKEAEEAQLQWKENLYLATYYACMQKLCLPGSGEGFVMLNQRRWIDDSAH